ncbi:hypothetical protein SAMN05444392_12320 [Seinonella peptonophila]|uniref:Uncharacterized protein n=1 Tax=Seinonella peptonophila TaxID=112248 RepID=A0A1M5BG75_9BACL|nr:hypothetical protein [Seinonella peptonophila]SHF41449.1 hypothetical protein SAMN05444392_12320 [Seinonella peptonophila]
MGKKPKATEGYTKKSWKRIDKLAAILYSFGFIIFVSGVLWAFIEFSLFRYRMPIATSILIGVALMVGGFFASRWVQQNNGEPVLGLVQEGEPVYSSGDKKATVTVKLYVATQTRDLIEAKLTLKRSKWDTAHFRPGTTLALLMDSEQQLVFDLTPRLSGAEYQQLYEQIAFETGMMSEEEKEIRQQGIEEQAVVLDITTVGSLAADVVDAVLTLQVTPVDGQAKEIQVSKQLPRKSFREIRKGSVLMVNYLSEQPERLLILKHAVNQPIQVTWD